MSVIHEKLTKDFDKLYQNLSFGKEEDFKKIRISENKLSSGSLAFDELTGYGLIKGSIVEMHSQEGLGKSTIASAIAGYLQGESNYFVEYIFTESKVNLDMMENMINTKKNFHLTMASDSAIAFDVMNKRVRSSVDKPSICILDSVSALIDMDEIDRDPSKSVKPGNLARIMSYGLKNLNSAMVGNKSIVLFLNQERMTGIGGFVVYSAPTGGKALPFYDALKIKLKKMKEEMIYRNKCLIGCAVEATVEKNSLAVKNENKPRLYIKYGFGWWQELETVRLGIDKGIYKTEEVATEEKKRGRKKQLIAIDGKGYTESALVNHFEKSPKTHKIYRDKLKKAIDKEREGK